MDSQNNSLIRDEMSAQIIDTAEQLTLQLGADRVTVRKILQALQVTNRVFYNRFHNLDEVLRAVYAKSVLQIRGVMIEQFDPDGDYFAQITQIATQILRFSYQSKLHFNRYIFETDVHSLENYHWWKAEILKLIAFGKEKGHLKNIDAEIMSDTVWCFIRGYTADAVGRDVPPEKALSDFTTSFGILLDGLRQ